MNNDFWPDDGEMTPEFIAASLDDFLYMYDIFRQENGLSKKIENVHEILSSMTDKLGRICRYVKHQERNDPKEDWPEGMTTEMAGLLIMRVANPDIFSVGDKNE